MVKSWKFAALGLAMWLAGTLCGQNLLTNPEFKSGDGQCPDGWTAQEEGDVDGAYVCTGGVLRISEMPSAALHAVEQTFPIDGSKSYWFEVDVLCDALANVANVRYSYIDAQGKEWKGPKPLFHPYYAGPQKEWKRAAVPIPAGDIARHFVKMRLRLLVENKSEERCADNAIYFRNPCVTPYAGQKNVPMNGGGPRRPDKLVGNPFHRLAPRPYVYERGGVGYLNLSSTAIPRHKLATFKVAAPKGVTYALYTSRQGERGLVHQPPEEDDPTRFECDDFVVWASNAWLLFTVDETVPDDFSFKFTLTVEEATSQVDAAVNCIRGPKPGKLPKTRRFSAYDCTPLVKFGDDALTQPLVQQLIQYWERAGWVRHSTFDFTAFIHYRQTMAEPVAREGEGVDGTPTGTFCDSDFVALGADRIAQVFEERGVADRIRSAEYTEWDYEPYVLGPVTSGCFCKKCRAAFGRECGFDTTATAREILQSKKSEWIAFRCRQRAATMRTTVEALKKINPKTKFCLCSMPHSPGPNDEAYWNEYGIDLPLYKDFVDVFRSMNYGRFSSVFRSVELECGTLGKPIQTLFENGWDSDPREGKLVGLHVLAGQFAGMDMPFIACGVNLADGDQISQLRRVMQFVGKSEHLWGEAKCVYGEEKSSCKVIEGDGAHHFASLEREAADGTRYVLLFNTSPGSAMRVFVKPPSGRSWRNPQRTVKLRPYGFKLIGFQPKESKKK